MRVIRRVVGTLVVTLAVGGFVAPPAKAHSLPSAVYVDLSSSDPGQVRAELRMYAPLLLMSTADYTADVELGQAGAEAQSDQDMPAQAAALDEHADSVLTYVTDHFVVTADGRSCSATKGGPVTAEQRDGQPYVRLVLDYECPEPAAAHEVRSDLFPASEGYVTDTKTIVTFDLDLNSGTAILDAEHRSFSTDQSFSAWFRSWFRVGAEHLVYGLDHVLFLLALIVGSRRLREIVLTATTFTLAHSVTFILAALGVVEAPRVLVEPLIAASIAFVAGWYLWRAWRHGQDGTHLPAGNSHFSLDRAGWSRLAVVFGFGLIHGLGFATSLGIDEPWSWKLLSSLLIFNLGIEAVQLTIVAISFPLLALLRHRSPRGGFWASAIASAAVALVGAGWFIERAADI